MNHVKSKLWNITSTQIKLLYCYALNLRIIGSFLILHFFYRVASSRKKKPRRPFYCFKALPYDWLEQACHIKCSGKYDSAIIIMVYYNTYYRIYDFPNTNFFSFLTWDGLLINQVCFSCLFCEYMQKIKYVLNKMHHW